MKLNTIKSMERLARRDDNIISLGQGIPASPTDPALREAAGAAIARGDADAYSDPQGIFELREAIARATAEEGMDYTADETLVTAGAIEAIGIALRSVISPIRRKVLLPTPAYSAYFSVIAQEGGEVVEVPTCMSDGWALPAEKLVEYMDDDVAAVLICNPNNPTGTVYSRASLEAVVHYAQQAGVTVILDEVYRHFIYDEASFYSPAEVSSYKDSIIRVMSFSKDFNMTGWRVGYLQASAVRMDKLTALHDSMINCAPVVSQYVALEALRHAPRIYAENRRTYSRRRTQMANWLESLGGRIRYQLPQAGYFFFPMLLDEHESQTASMRLAHAGVVVLPGSAFGESGEGHVRLCFGRSEVSIDEGMRRLVGYYGA